MAPYKRPAQAKAEQLRGEKRKRKLQYLQQLVRDESTEPQSGLSAESVSDPRSRLPSADYDAQLLYPDPITAASASIYLETSLSQHSHTPSQTMALPEASNYPIPAVSVPSSFAPAWTAPLLQPQPQSPPSMWNVPQWMFTEPEAAPPQMNAPGYQFPPHNTSNPQHLTPVMDHYSTYDGFQLPIYTTPQTVQSNVYHGAVSSHGQYSSVSRDQFCFTWSQMADLP